MASYTTNLNLKKPAGSENVAIGDINNNMDTIDQAYGTLNGNITDMTTRSNSAFTGGTGIAFSANPFIQRNVTVVPNAEANFDITATDGIGSDVAIGTFTDTTLYGSLFAKRIGDTNMYPLKCSQGVLKTITSMPKANAYYLCGCLVGNGL